MKRFNNFVNLQAQGELDSRYAAVIKKKCMATPEFINRLGLYGELESHAGCVNCLEWSTDGKILASGSDDLHVVLWDPFKKKELLNIPTGHHGNIFTVKFIPNTNNRILVSGAADYSVRIHDAVSKEVIGICTCHTNRVKRCCTDPVSPSLFWSAGEDGVVIQHDLRTSHTCPSSDDKKTRSNVMIDLRKFIGSKAEAKCIAINPIRSEHIAVGANDPFVRIYDRRMIKSVVDVDSTQKNGAVQYFVPGHLPSKIGEYKRKYRSLASTYVTFSPDGKELLVNLGGEQIYLFPLSKDLQADVSMFSVPGVASNVRNGEVCTNGYKNGLDAKSCDEYPIFQGMRPIRKPDEKAVLSLSAESLKKSANDAFDTKNYLKAVNLYNEAILICPYSAILYGNRAAALLKRAWDGDSYAALKDCQSAVFLDREHFKAYLRISRCLVELKKFKEAAACLNAFKKIFPDHCNTVIFKAIEKDVAAGLASELTKDSNGRRKCSKESTSSTSSESQSSMGSSFSAMQRNSAAAFLRRSGEYVLRFGRSSSETDGSVEVNESENVDEDDSSMDNDAFPFVFTSDSSSSSPIGVDGDTKSSGPKQPEYEDMEFSFREKAIDFRARFCGSCNTTTDIKEANFFGGYILAGSDDGRFFIWDRETTNIVKSIKGDESIVNCLQPHPDTCMLATSGIESVVRLWTVMPEEDYVNDRVVQDVNDAAYANQKRMNSNPFEVILMNMGYHMNSEDDVSEEDTSAEVPMPCHPS